MLRFHPHPPLEIYKRLVPKPMDALLLNHARQAVRDRDGVLRDGLCQAARTYLRLGGSSDPACMFRGDQAEAAQACMQGAIDALIGRELTGASDFVGATTRFPDRESAERLFLASVLIESHACVDKEYELQKIAARFGLGERVFMENMLQDRMVRMHSMKYAGEYTDFLCKGDDAALDWMRVEKSLMQQRLGVLNRYRDTPVPRKLSERFEYLSLLDGFAQLNARGLQAYRS